MKALLPIALTAVITILSHPAAMAQAENAALIGDANRFCTGWMDKRINPKPKNPDQWVSQCRPLAEQQDNCVRGQGWKPGDKATAATTACWDRFMGSLNSIPVN